MKPRANESLRYLVLVLAIACYAIAGVVYANVSNPVGATIGIAAIGTVFLLVYLFAPAKWCDAIVQVLTFAGWPWFY